MGRAPGSAACRLHTRCATTKCLCLPTASNRILSNAPLHRLQDIVKKEDAKYFKFAVGTFLGMQYQVWHRTG